jgi:signal transduction histidine kinase
VLGAAGELRQALANLVSNAIDAVPQHGKITLSVRPAQTTGECSAQIIIEDDGPGIAAEHFTQIFEPFFTTKKNVGTGLGLYITREIVERHGGTVDVLPSSNNSNRGATFVLHLPHQGNGAATQSSLGVSDHIAR